MTETVGPVGHRLRDGTARSGAGLAGSPGAVTAAWGALFMNVLAFAVTPASLPIPQTVGQLITQGMLPLALMLALVANPGAVIRPNLFLLLWTLLGLVKVMVSIHNEYMLGSTYRAYRCVVFVTVLWLLTPVWGRSDLILLRAHRRCLSVILGSVLLGALLFPGRAFSFDGRVQGVLWPIPPTQVAHYSAVLLGTTAVLWMCQLIRGRSAAVLIVVCAGTLLATHTRTALLACLVALAVAGASLFLGHVRVRRATLATGVLASVCGAVFATQIQAWMLRGQSTEEASQLTGRSKVWSQVWAVDRPRIEDVFGSGLSDKSFNGLPIDSNWVSTYLDQGWFGIAVQATILLLLLMTALTRRRGHTRALALFLIVYCAVASFTETAADGPSPYLLDLAVAAALLATPAPGARR